MLFPARIQFTATTTLASSATLDNSTSTAALALDGLTLEPFVPASQSTRKGRGARRRRGTPLQHIGSNPLDPIITAPEYDYIFIISTDSDVPLSDIDVIKANEQSETCLGGRPKNSRSSVQGASCGGIIIATKSPHLTSRDIG